MIGVLYFVQKEVGDADYTGQGGPDFVGHRRKKVGFDSVGFLCLFFGGNQLSLILLRFCGIYYLKDKIRDISLLVFYSANAKPSPFCFSTFCTIDFLPL